MKNIKNNLKKVGLAALGTLALSGNPNHAQDTGLMNLVETQDSLNPTEIDSVEKNQKTLYLTNISPDASLSQKYALEKKIYQGLEGLYTGEYQMIVISDSAGASLDTIRLSGDKQ
jgi:hypothetical protein